LIDPDQVFDRDHDRDENFSIKVCLKFFNQGLMKNFSSGSDDQKLTTCALSHRNRSRRKIAPVHYCWTLRSSSSKWVSKYPLFSIRVRLKIFNQGLLKKFQSGFD
jgi:hypothetical protein